MRIAVLSDVHAAAGTFEAALLAARTEGFDQLVLLGDLLTYGVEPERTIDLAARALSDDDAVLILGNHDQLYLDRRSGRTDYLDTLPDWIRESVDWTCGETHDARALEAFAWKEDWVAGPLLISHANPYGHGDWRYLSTPEQAEAAGAVLSRDGLRWGVFGHTHRFRRFEGETVSLFTVGSLGQARDQGGGGAQWAMVDLSEDSFRISQRPVSMDRDAHLKAIRMTTMSQPTKDRLCAFFPL